MKIIILFSLFLFTATFGFACSEFKSLRDSGQFDSQSGSGNGNGNGNGNSEQPGTGNPVRPDDSASSLAHLPKGADSLAAICQRRGADLFTATFCSATPPQITSLRDLQAALKLTDPANSACTAHSASIVKHETSVLNPRCINFSHNGASTRTATALGYLRAELTFAEVVSQDPSTGELRFFLVDYELPCEKSPAGCTKADYYLESAESNWSTVSFYEDFQIKNTVFDCASCHQPGGPGTRKLLRMAQTDENWLHWLREDQACGQQLLADFMGAHSGETRYAGLTLDQVRKSDPARLENFVEDNGFKGALSGNSIFDSLKITTEMLTGTSATWQQRYNAISTMTNHALDGAVTMPPPRCRQSDPQRLTNYTNIYRNVRAGTAAPSTMPSLHTVNLDSENDLRERGLLPKAGLSPRQLLANACMACHNSSLDQTISRSNFNAQDLTKNTPAVYAKVLDRIARPKTDVLKMPPSSFMNLTDAEIQLLVPYINGLRTNGASGPDAVIANAAPPTPGKEVLFEDFNGGSTSVNFEMGVYHRDGGWHVHGRPINRTLWENSGHGGSWRADYDLVGGKEGTSRTLTSSLTNMNPGQVNYMAHDKWMTSMAEIDSYSVVWFSPYMPFQNVGEITFDVSLADLGARKWWKVAIVSEAIYNSLVRGNYPGDTVPGHLRSDIGSASGLNPNLEENGLLYFTWSGSAGHGGGMKIGNSGGGGPSNPSPNDRYRKHPVRIKDNGNGTMTFTVAGVSFTRNGSFPAGAVRVIFYDHNYTPDKDGVPISYTWHWDNVRVLAK